MKTLIFIVCSSFVSNFPRSKNSHTIQVQDSLWQTRPQQDPSGLHKNRPYIEFTDKTIKEVMVQFAAAYRIKQVIYKKGVDTVTPGLLGGGHVATDAPLLEILGRLERYTGVHFQVSKKIITVYPSTSVLKID